MKIYELRRGIEFKSLSFEDIADVEEASSYFHLKPIGNRWWNMKVHVIEEDWNQKLPFGDFSTLSGGVPIFSEGAVKTLGKVLEQNGEVLPVTCSTRKLYAYNITNIVDVFDEEKSSVLRFDSGKIMLVNSYVFTNLETLQKLMIFSIPQMQKHCFVTDQFVSLVEQGGLKGFRFLPLWSHDH